MSKSLKKVFGIDLGTTYSSIAYVDEFGKPVVVPNMENQNTTPSVVFFDGEDIVVGEVAKESAKLYPDEVVSFVKRSMGDANFIFEYNDKNYRAEEISSYILKKIAQDAEQNLGEKITDVVITCPAYFGINEREATRLAGEIAGLNVRQIINEPTAAAIAYGATDPDQKKTVLVYDLGGGTFDVTMISITPEAIEVICTGGDHNLGGKDWDDRIVTYLVDEFQNQTGTDEDILEDPDTWQDLQLSAEKAKKVLSQREKTPISITHGGERVKLELQKDKFEGITSDLLERTVDFTHAMLKEAGKKGYLEFDEIILVGGSTRMPQIKNRLKQEFAVEPKIFDPDEAVAKGAAIFGWKLSMNDQMVQRIKERSEVKVESDDDVLDVTPDLIFDEVAKELSLETGYKLPAVEGTKVRISNVTSKSFGIVVRDEENVDTVYNLILRNTSVPVDIVKAFYTAESGQKSVLLRIMENETGDTIVPAEAAIEIGTAVLYLPDGLPAEAPVEISFMLNQEGRLKIMAIEKTGGQSVDVAVETSSVIQGKELEEAKSRCQSLIVK